jgi:hypothetical protein
MKAYKPHSFWPDAREDAMIHFRFQLICTVRPMALDALTLACESP